MNQRTFKTPKGTELPLMDIKGKPYLSIQHRIVWFREDHPDWSIETIIIHHDLNTTLAEAIIKDSNGRALAQGHKKEDKQGFADHYEKAESGAIGRALGFLGYGTAFALDLEEGQRLADAPTNEKIDMHVAPQDESPWPADQVSSTPNYADIQPEDFFITFGKFKNRSIKDVLKKEGGGKLGQYCDWLESDARSKGKPISENTSNFIEASRAAIEMQDFGPPKENLNEKLSRLKNEFDPNEEMPF